MESDIWFDNVEWVRKVGLNLGYIINYGGSIGGGKIVVFIKIVVGNKCDF